MKKSIHHLRRRVVFVWATPKIKHYMLAFKVLLIARMDPLKYLIKKPMQDRKTAKWALH